MSILNFYGRLCLHFTVDLYHSYLGMISLALIDEPGLQPADPVLCAGINLTRNLEKVSWWQEAGP